MRKRTLAWLAACLTIAGTMTAQITFGDSHVRIHQHRMSEKGRGRDSDALACVGRVQEKTGETGAAAVDVEEFSTHLPLVEIETEEEISGKPYTGEGKTDGRYTLSADGNEFIIANMKIYDGEGMHTIHDNPNVKTQIRIKVRGNTSRYFDKKSWAVKTIHSNGENKNISIMGMEENHDWVLHGPFLDKTLIRNYMAMNISGELMDYAPDVRFCEVVLNGSYEGVYVMMETVSRGQGRIEIEKPQHIRNVTGYIIELDYDERAIPGTAMDNFTKYTQNIREHAFFDICYPSEQELTPEIKEFIEKDVSRFEKALYSFDYDTSDYGYWNYIDMDEFVDYVILMEVFLQHDTGNLSTYFYKGVNGRYKPCVWDFNNNLENINDIVVDDFYIRKFVTVQAPWFWMMMKDGQFTDSIIKRYAVLRKGILSDEYLTDYIDETAAWLGDAVERNYRVWGYSFDPSLLNMHNKLHPDERNPRSYGEALEQMEDMLLQRLAWLDENIQVLRQYSHESAVKKFNH